MSNEKLYATDLSTTRHAFRTYHFCRGNSNRRKSRLGVILKGNGTYIYLNKRLRVNEGDVVFIPENIYCYSEWHGTPDIEVLYLSCFLHYESFTYEPQIIPCAPHVKDDILTISDLLSPDASDELEAYSLFYRLLRSIVPLMQKTTVAYDKTLACAIEYLTDHYDQIFSIGEVARHCCVSESTLYHLFSRELGQTPLCFLNSIRINIAIEYLENTSYSISTISRLVAFPSENHFRKTFRKFTGTTPLKFRKGGNEPQ